MFPSEASASGHLEGMQHLHARIGEACGAKFWFHALRDCLITVADRELMLSATASVFWTKFVLPPEHLPNHSLSAEVAIGQRKALLLLVHTTT